MKRRPGLITPATLDVPAYATLALPNGVNIHTVPCDDCSVVRFSFVFRAGTAAQSVPFAASATANMLCEGTERYTSQQVAERLDYLGSYFDVNVDRDCVYIS
ncbi:MAG: insulinase family protein, partial [Alistipes sp.]|nr:insulinase family protein [Alistipes sp.]